MDILVNGIKWERNEKVKPIQGYGEKMDLKVFGK